MPQEISGYNLRNLAILPLLDRRAGGIGGADLRWGQSGKEV